MFVLNFSAPCTQGQLSLEVRGLHAGPRTLLTPVTIRSNNQCILCQDSLQLGINVKERNVMFQMC